MRISPDSIIFWQQGVFTLNGTILFTWMVMALVVMISILVTRHLSSDVKLSKGQNLLEGIVFGILGQIREVHKIQPDRHLPFLGTLFLFIALSNILSVVPGFTAPTGSLSTTAALALCVFFAVPIWGISQTGLQNYLKNYIQPTPFMLPFNVMGELTRTLALAMRLFGNIMSGSMIAAIMLAIAPIFFPAIMQFYGLLTGLVQAYIFAVLAAVYIAAGMEVHEKQHKNE
jgi:F-type H+-transporting ATPase subunit a